MLLHMVAASLLPTLQAFDHFVHEGSIPEPQGHLCVRHDMSVHPHTPRFWANAASVVASSEGDCVPRCLQGIVPHVVAAGKAVALLRAHRQTHSSVAESLQSARSWGNISDRSGDNLCPLWHALSSALCRRTRNLCRCAVAASMPSAYLPWIGCTPSWTQCSVPTLCSSCRMGLQVLCWCHPSACRHVAHTNP